MLWGGVGGGAPLFASYRAFGGVFSCSQLFDHSVRSQHCLWPLKYYCALQPVERKAAQNGKKKRPDHDAQVFSICPSAAPEPSGQRDTNLRVRSGYSKTDSRVRCMSKTKLFWFHRKQFTSHFSTVFLAFCCTSFDRIVATASKGETCRSQSWALLPADSGGNLLRPERFTNWDDLFLSILTEGSLRSLGFGIPGQLLNFFTTRQSLPTTWSPYCCPRTRSRRTSRGIAGVWPIFFSALLNALAKVFGFFLQAKATKGSLNLRVIRFLLHHAHLIVVKFSATSHNLKHRNNSSCFHYGLLIPMFSSLFVPFFLTG